jgi:hypothetical protein
LTQTTPRSPPSFSLAPPSSLIGHLSNSLLRRPLPLDLLEILALPPHRSSHRQCSDEVHDDRALREHKLVLSLLLLCQRPQRDGRNLPWGHCCLVNTNWRTLVHSPAPSLSLLCSCPCSCPSPQLLRHGPAPGQLLPQAQPPIHASIVSLDLPLGGCVLLSLPPLHREAVPQIRNHSVLL